MADLFKKLLYTSVGFASIASEKLQQTVEELVDKSKLSSEEGKKIVDDFMETTEEKREEFESKLTRIVEDVVDTFDFPKGNLVTELTNRIEALEAKLGLSEAEAEPAPAKAAKKTTAKRTTRKTTKKS